MMRFSSFSRLGGSSVTVPRSSIWIEYASSAPTSECDSSFSRVVMAITDDGKRFQRNPCQSAYAVFSRLIRFGSRGVRSVWSVGDALMIYFSRSLPEFTKLDSSSSGLFEPVSFMIWSRTCAMSMEAEGS